MTGSASHASDQPAMLLFFASSMMIVAISSGVLSSVAITISAFSEPFVLSMP